MKKKIGAIGDAGTANRVELGSLRGAFSSSSRSTEVLLFLLLGAEGTDVVFRINNSTWRRVEISGFFSSGYLAFSIGSRKYCIPGFSCHAKGLAFGGSIQIYGADNCYRTARTAALRHGCSIEHINFVILSSLVFHFSCLCRANRRIFWWTGRSHSVGISTVNGIKKLLLVH